MVDVMLLVVYFDQRVKTFLLIEDESYRKTLVRKAIRLAEAHLHKPDAIFSPETAHEDGRGKAKYTGATRRRQRSRAYLTIS